MGGVKKGQLDLHWLQIQQFFLHCCDIFVWHLTSSGSVRLNSFILHLHIIAFCHCARVALCLKGPCSVKVYRFRDPVHGPRKIPDPHPGMLDPALMALVLPGEETHFAVQNGDLLLKDPHYAPGCELYRIGRHFRYEVVQPSAN